MNGILMPPIAEVPAPLNALRCHLGECVLWDAHAGRVLWTDIQARCLYGYTPASGALQRWDMPSRLTCFALGATADRLLLGFEHTLASFDLKRGGLRELCRLPVQPGVRINDGRCDRAGNFVFGEKNERDARPIGRFWRYTVAGELQALALPLVAIANSLCFSRDGTRIHFADSRTGQMQCADYDAASGAVSAIRPFGPHFGAGVDPDGAVVDDEDGVWCALWGGSRIVRLDPAGRVSTEIALPVSLPACPGFGGPALDTLYVASARDGLSAQTRRVEPLAGALLELSVPGVRGCAETPYGGAL